MTEQNLSRRGFLKTLAVAGTTCVTGSALAQQPGLKEPVYRVSKNDSATSPPAERHPLDPALDMARDALALVQRDIVDYTATIVKRERIKGTLGEYEFMEAKIRNRKVVDGKLVVPLSVYLKFVKPASAAGREVVWVEGQNGNKLRAHEGGLKGKILKAWLDPESSLAMRGQLHPIYDIGIENLVTKLIERGEKEKKYGECEVTFTPGAKINGRVCTVLRVIHPVQRPHFEFHKAEIFIDDQMKVPVRYAAFFWPQRAGDTELPVLEEYTYLNVKLGLVGNPLLTDEDFNSENPNYDFN